MKWIGISLLLISPCSFAAEPLRLEQIVESVEKSYPVVIGAGKDVEAAQGEITASEGAFDLTWKNRLATSTLGYYENSRFDSVLEKPLGPLGATIFTGYRLGRGNFAVYDEKALTLSQGEGRIGFEVSLWRNRPTDRRRTNLEKSRLALSAAEANAVQTRIEAVRTASQRYWDWVAAGKRVAIFRTLLTIAEARDKGLLERVKHGDVPVFERKDNERAILQRRAQLVTAERGLQQTAIELSLFLRDASGNPRLPSENELPSDIPRYISRLEPQISSDINKALEQRPELARLAATREQSSAESEWADNQLSPRLDLQVAASRDFGLGLTTRAGTEVEAAVLLEIPLERRLASGRRENARATIARVEATERLMRDRIGAEVRDTHSALRAAIARIDIAVSETELARTLEQGERDRFEHGDSNILFVNLREQATADALVREVEALADYQKGLAQLRGVLGEI
jgi:cobalt-zinc-cadmium efflux system outer membrane protein